MEIEMFICFQDGSWETMWAKIPSGGLAKDIDLEPKRRPWNEEAIKYLVRQQVMDMFGDDDIAFFGILPEFEAHEDEGDEIEEEEENEKEMQVSTWVIAAMVLMIMAVIWITWNAA